MATEIELKYLLEQQESNCATQEIVQQKISQLFDSLKLDYQHKQNKLVNTYFDTNELALRQLDCGLRVRQANDYCEQTIKTAGKTIAGLHQRPEYNVAITGSQPTLSLFPQDIWPKGSDVEQLQSQLVALFTTNFTRHTWKVTTAFGKVEIAYDQGVISSGVEQCAINEIELELVSGDVNALFTLAKELFKLFAMRPGTTSKAARGYQLWHLQKDMLAKKGTESNDLPLASEDLLVPLKSSFTTEQALTCGSEYCLTQLQNAITQYLLDTKLSSLNSVDQILHMIAHGLLLFSGGIEERQLTAINQPLTILINELSWLDNALHIKDLTKKTGRYRKRIEYSQQLTETLKLERSRFPSEQKITELLLGEQANLLQLALLELVINPEPKSHQVQPLSEFSVAQLEKSLTNLIAATPKCSSMTAEQQLAILLTLRESMLTGSWFGNLFPIEARSEYRRPWLDILLGIEELATLALLKHQLTALEQQSDKLVDWLESKIDNLVDAINASRDIAITIAPYWRTV